MQNVKCFVTPKSLRYRRFSTDFVTEEKSEANKKSSIKLCMELLGINSRDTASKFVKRHPALQCLDPINATHTFNMLVSMNVSVEDIKRYPSVLNLHPTTLQNRTQILLEAGFRKGNIHFHHIQKYLSICKQSLEVFKLYDWVDADKDIPASLLASFELEPSALCIDYKATLLAARKSILEEYLRRVLNFNDTDVQNHWESYNRIKHKSGASILEMVKLLKDELGYTNDIIKNHAFVLHGNPENLKEILRRFDTIGGIPTKEFLIKRPKVCMVNPDSISATLSVLQKFNINHEHIKHCLDIVTLSPQTIERRLTELKTLPDFEILSDHPRVLKLVMFQTKAKARMEYLKQLKFKCISLNVLSTSNSIFERHTREGADKTSGLDIVLFIVRHFQKPEKEIRDKFVRHPRWNCVPLSVMKHNLEFLLKLNFTKDDIYKHIYILLYPTVRIEEKLKLIAKDEKCKNATKAQILSLLLYYIELDYHFSGDAIWVDFDVLQEPTDGSTADMLSINLVKFGQKTIDEVYPSRDYSYKRSTLKK
ncbi:transcription termination factor 5, mitochondrial [Culicoides brevitarsis]|uniref:transcription termination factor 5, mitochondrial n=1 Tax=Culicoides brevitarsis TaxID=469753 RepID=UPI00307C2EED